MNMHQPIIVIGTGRAGTTLLTRILGSHPDITFYGETSFLLPRLWIELWEDHFWFNWQKYFETNPKSACEKFPDISNDILMEEQKRVGQILARVITEVFKVNPETHSVWGYKEIWNGHNSSKYDWLPYDIVFPEAIWVHIIRNPFDFAKSCARWNKDILTFNYLRSNLANWVSIVKHSRNRKETERYFEIRFEDIIEKPEETLLPIFNKVNLNWHPNCNSAMKCHVFHSQPNTGTKTENIISPDKLKKLVNEVKGLVELMDELNYEIPREIEKEIINSCELYRLHIIDLHNQPSQLTQAHQSQYLIGQKYSQLQQEHQSLKQSQQQLQQEHQSLQQSKAVLLVKELKKYPLLVKLGPWALIGLDKVYTLFNNWKRMFRIL